MKQLGKWVPTVVAIALVAGAWEVYRRGFAPREALVVYCAHDATYSRAVLDRFTRETGIEVKVKEDTEATKSLGLVELLAREKASPRCDVFWNNELLGMLHLQEQGVLEPYKGPGYARIPDAFKDPGGHWCGFGARARVIIANTGKVSPLDPSVVTRMLESGDLSRTAIARPLFGTTLTHYAALWQRLGSSAVKSWHEESRRKNMREVNGNAVTKDLVAEGVCDLGYTDTDDFFVAKDAGAPVAMFPVRLPDGATICIPNTVAVIKGTRRRESARKLADFLLSAENELALARSAARQLPLGPVDESSLPEEVRSMLPWLAESVALGELAVARRECLEWLKKTSR